MNTLFFSGKNGINNMLKSFNIIQFKGGKMFKLHSEYKPTGDQPKAIEYLSKGIMEGKKFQTLLGVTGSRKNFYNGEYN